MLLFFDDTSAAKFEDRQRKTGNKRGTSKIIGRISGVYRNKIRKKRIHINIYQQKHLDFDLQPTSPPDHVLLDIYLWENYIHYCRQL